MYLAQTPVYRGRMPGTMTKAQALEWLVKYGATVRGYPQEAAAAYLGLGVKRFRDDVTAGLLPQPDRHGKRLVWDRVALDRHMDKALDAASGRPAGSGDDLPTTDPIMGSIHAAKLAALRPGDPR